MRKVILIVLGTLGVAALASMAVVLRDHSTEGDPFETPVAQRTDLETVAGKKVFFAHQSVGANLMDALPGVFTEADVSAPVIVESQAVPSSAGFVHMRIGENGDPLGKIAEFDRIMRSGMADGVDAAVLKLCYVDFRAGTDVEKVFAAYRDTFAALERDYPGTAFVAATVPLTIERGPLGKVKAVLGRGDTLGPEHNIVREQFNALMRVHYPEPGTLFDIAGVESTGADGDREAYKSRGETYYALNREYAADPGHLNDGGASAVASAFVATVSDAVA